MTPTELELARELARHPKWKWGRGMLAICDNRLERVVRTADDGRGLLCGTDATGPKHYPDLADPATQGCLMAALGDQLQVVETFYPSLDPGAGRMWAVETRLDTSEYPWISEGATLGEALARAWLAAQGGGEHG